MKFLCIDCDEVMSFAERQLPGDGTLAAVYSCSSCGREIAMLTNPMETQFVSGLGVKIGGREVPEQPFELVRSHVEDGREDAFEDVEAGEDEVSSSAAGSNADGQRVTWDDDAVERLARVPSFVRGMVKRIYTDYARERGIPVITTAIMDRARTELGLEGM